MTVIASGNPSCDKLTALVGRLFRAKAAHLIEENEVGDIFLLTGVVPLVKYEEGHGNLDQDGLKLYDAEIWKHYPEAVICELLYGEKLYKHAMPNHVVFSHYFELIEGV